LFFFSPQLANVNRKVWSTVGGTPPGPLPTPQPATNFKVLLTPMQIRTFAITMQ
jgi:hypothetical protein